MGIDRRGFATSLSAVAAGLMAGSRWTAIAPVPRVAAAQTAALKELVPNGWSIGVALDQRQSDGIDTVAVDLVTRQFNSITPENLLKFESVQRQPGVFTFDAQDRCVAFGADRGMSVIGVFLKHRDDITRVTFWGVSDGDSWLKRGRVNHPLLWDRQRQPKPAFDEVTRVLAGKRTSSR